MTPAQRAYMVDLVRSMRRQAQWIDRKVPGLAITLNQGADALEICANTLPLVQPSPGAPESAPEPQPASSTQVAPIEKTEPDP